MLTCKEVSTLYASDAVHEAPWPRRVAVRLHLLMCRHCSRYVRELRAIGVAARRSAAQRTSDDAAAERLRLGAMDVLRSGHPDSTAGS